LRCVRSAVEQYRQGSSAPAIRFAQAARRELELPARLLQDHKFGERLKQVGRIVFERHRDTAIELDGTRAEPPQCYLCGIALTRSGHSKRTVEHVWPLSLGGETVEHNLVLACEDCNSKRGNMMTWAYGPVQSTYYTRSSNNPKTKSPPANLRLSLGLARLLQVAAPTRGRRHSLTLKEAIRIARPAIPDLDVQEDRPYVYFELLQKCGS
jgi:5-methylcytosine-specific restriction endonuclease McrA